MRPVKSETSNVTFVGEGCNDLPATKFTHNNLPIIETVWELTDEEKQEIQSSGKIYLYVVGQTVQPCLLSTEPIE